MTASDPSPVPGGASPVPVTLYTRADCHLCEDARAALDTLARTLPIEVVAIDIDMDPDLRARFNDHVPVVAVDGEVVTSAPVDLAAIRTAVRAAIEGAPTA